MHLNLLFCRWIDSVAGKIEGIVAVDGKTIQNICDDSSLHMLTAYASQSGLAIGQVSTGEKGDEYAAIPKLLQDLDVSGCLITIDAAGCYKEIAEVIHEQCDAGYLLQVKGNQPTLHSELISYFDYFDKSIANETTKSKTRDIGHGRKEVRNSLLQRMC